MFILILKKMRKVSKYSLLFVLLTSCVGNNLDFGYEYTTRNFQERRRAKIKKYQDKQQKMKGKQKIKR